MKLSTTFFQLCVPALATAGLSVSFSGGTTINVDDKPVPGKNPLNYCNPEQPDNDILAIEHVNLDPNPPAPGTTLTIEAAGTFVETVERGAYMNLQVKYGLIRIINQREDLCDQLKNVDTECPVGPGPVKVVKEVSLPAQIPPGKYTVEADVYTEDNRHITCLKSQIEFHRS